MYGCKILCFQHPGKNELEMKNMQTQEKTESPKELWHNPFVDVQQEQWFAPGVQFVTERGWMRPWRDRRFGPRGVINKQTFYTILHRASCGSCGTAAELFPRGSEEPFPAGGWYEPPGYGREAVPLLRKAESGHLCPGRACGHTPTPLRSRNMRRTPWAGPWGQGSSEESKPARVCTLSPWNGTTRAQAATVLLRWWTWAGQPDTMGRDGAMP